VRGEEGDGAPGSVGGARRVALGPGAEFDRIRSFLGARERECSGEVRIGPGDDGAVLSGGWIVSTDLSVEEIHFRRDWITPREVGYRATAAALSDLAAMAARPVGGLASVALPVSDPHDVGVALHEGIWDALSAVEGVLLGGDLTASPGPRIVDVTVLGRTRRPVLRSGARPGDELWVTGRLGGAAGAVRAWESGREPPPALRERFVRPRPRVKEIRWLRDRCDLRSLIDLSDGLAGDAAHLAAAGGVSPVIQGASVPVEPLLREWAGEEEAIDLALGGGEDYELLLVAPPGSVGEWAREFAERFGLPLTRIGRIEDGEGVLWIPPGEEEPRLLAAGGFDHFDGARGG